MAEADSAGVDSGRAPLDTAAPGLLPDVGPLVPESLARPRVERPTLQRWPIVWNDEREALTQAYLAHHHGGPLTGDPSADSHMVPRMVVIHWTAGPNLRSARATFLAPTQKNSRRRSRWNLVNLSAHFLVDRDGARVQLMEPTRVGRHTIGLNHLAIGIENVGDRDRWPLTRSQVESNAALLRWLVQEHPSITHLIGHYEYRRFEGTPLFRDQTRFRTGRNDPGKPFMEALRYELRDLGLLGPPEGAR